MVYTYISTPAVIYTGKNKVSRECQHSMKASFGLVDHPDGSYKAWLTDLSITTGEIKRKQ